MCVSDVRLSISIQNVNENAKFGVVGEEEPYKELAYEGCRTVVVNTQHWYAPSKMCGRLQK